MNYNFKICEILLGIPSNDNFIKILNFIILNVKYYINKQRSNFEPLNLFEIINKLKYKLKQYEIISQINDTKMNFTNTYGILLESM